MLNTIFTQHMFAITKLLIYLNTNLLCLLFTYSSAEGRISISRRRRISNHEYSVHHEFCKS